MTPELRLAEKIRKRVFEIELEGEAEIKAWTLEDIAGRLQSGEIDCASAKEALAGLKGYFDSKPKPPPQEDDHGNVWDEPEALPGLPPVPVWKPELGPAELAPSWADIAERIQCPPDFPPVPGYVSAASLIGTKCGIRPKRKDNWVVVPNLWGMSIGRPSAMKTPPSAEVLKSMKRLQIDARSDFETREFDRVSAKAQLASIKDALKSRGGKAPKKIEDYRADFEAAEAAMKQAGARKRYMVQEPTTEQLGQILSENPQGVMLYRDELKGWLRSLEKQGREGDRAFYIECWNGTGSFVYDRVERGEIAIPAACVSIYGTIQPGPLRSMLRAAVDGTGDDDGMIQRFQLMVYPDRLKTWRNVDEFPDSGAKQKAWAVYQRLSKATAEDFGATTEEDFGATEEEDKVPVDIPFLRFTPEAQKLFDTWRTIHENRLLQGDEHPAFEAHLTKYRSLIPSLALINHLVDVGKGSVGIDALERAIAYAEHLEAHARRVYASVSTSDVDAAKALLGKLRAGAVTDDRGNTANPFHARDVYRKGWAGLADSKIAHAAIDRLRDFGWVQRRIEGTQTKDRADIYVHPSIEKGWK